MRYRGRKTWTYLEEYSTSMEPHENWEESIKSLDPCRVSELLTRHDPSWGTLITVQGFSIRSDLGYNLNAAIA
jgi:hypothetical protein